MPNHIRRRLAFWGAASLALACLVWPAVTGAGTSGAPRNWETFIDPSGDAQGGAPDISTATVSNDDRGQITFAITLANRTTLSSTDRLVVAMDTDGNASNGVDGADYELEFVDARPRLLGAEGGSWRPTTPASPFHGSFASGVLTLSVNTSDIRKPTWLAFFIAASGDAAGTIGDYSPDSHRWHYSVLIGPGPPSDAPPPPPLAETKPSLSRAVAGKPFIASAVVTINGMPVQGNVTCVARTAGRILRQARRSVAADGKATCRWRLPKIAHGKRLAGSIGETYLGARVVRSFSTTVG